MVAMEQIALFDKLSIEVSFLFSQYPFEGLTVLIAWLKAATLEIILVLHLKVLT
jgi:hypothetical protein